MIDKQTVDKLESERDQRIKSASDKLLAKDDLAGAEKDLTWVDTSSKLITFAHHAARIRWTIIFSMICLVFVGLLWTVHVRSTHITVELYTDNLALTLKQEWLSRLKFLADHVYINNLQEIGGHIQGTTAGDLKKPCNLKLPVTLQPDQMPFGFDLQGANLEIDELKLGAAAELELTWADAMLKLFVKKKPMQGQLYLKQAALRLETDYEDFECRVNYEPPETLTFKTIATIAQPALLEIATSDDWRLQRIQAQRIGFLRETKSASGKFESAIRSGQVEILDTKTKRTLREGDYLIIEKIKTCQRLEISKAKQGMKVLFEGEVSSVKIGPEGFHENITPRYLMFIYHHKLLMIFWGALLFVWGVLWRTRAWLGK